MQVKFLMAVIYFYAQSDQILWISYFSSVCKVGNKNSSFIFIRGYTSSRRKSLKRIKY